ncbi:MAG: CheY-like chemotaxis protein [Nitrospinales bacterium]
MDALTTEGFEVLEAADGNSGLEMILKKQFDLILCDRVMEGKSGYMLLEELRDKYPDKLEIPFVFLTALDELTETTFHTSPQRLFGVITVSPNCHHQMRFRIFALGYAFGNLCKL